MIAYLIRIYYTTSIIRYYLSLMLDLIIIYMEVRMDLVSQKLVKLIEKNANSLTKSWLDDIKNHDASPTYHNYDGKKLYERAFSVYSQLGKWVSRETTKEDIKKVYIELGKNRKSEGFACSEVIYALIVTRRHLWLKILSEGFLNTALDLHQGMGLNNRVVLFFDRAMYYVSLGYED